MPAFASVASIAPIQLMMDRITQMERANIESIHLCMAAGGLWAERLECRSDPAGTMVHLRATCDEWTLYAQDTRCLLDATGCKLLTLILGHEPSR
mmetsp:Transcript_8821/g.20009  ORF Transcript_8821/g.20009 Transcript_8821/m.20009 type:complete len:95 (-) Transcript_8821:67-351(-)